MMFAENDRVLSRVMPRYVCTLGGGVVDRDGEVLEPAGLPREEKQFPLVKVELEVVGRHPT